MNKSNNNNAYIFLGATFKLKPKEHTLNHETL